MAERQKKEERKYEVLSGDEGREKLIEICDKALVEEARWSTRDTASAMNAIGGLRAMLMCGVQYEHVRTNFDESPGTIWIRIHFRGFDHMTRNVKRKKGTEGVGPKDVLMYYIPTPEFVDLCNGADWKNEVAVNRRKQRGE